jgi:hypothetical protein
MYELNRRLQWLSLHLKLSVAGGILGLTLIKLPKRS